MYLIVKFFQSKPLIKCKSKKEERLRKRDWRVERSNNSYSQDTRFPELVS